MAKQFFFRGYAGAVRRCFGFASTVIVGTATAAQNAATQRAVSNCASPTAATSGARKADWTIVTGSASTGSAVLKPA